MSGTNWNIAQQLREAAIAQKEEEKLLNKRARSRKYKEKKRQKRSKSSPPSKAAPESSNAPTELSVPNASSPAATATAIPNVLAEGTTAPKNVPTLLQGTTASTNVSTEPSDLCDPAAASTHVPSVGSIVSPTIGGTAPSDPSEAATASANIPSVASIASPQMYDTCADSETGDLSSVRLDSDDAKAMLDWVNDIRKPKSVDDTICAIPAPRDTKLFESLVDELEYRGDQCRKRYDLDLAEQFYRRAIECRQEYLQRRRYVVYKHSRVYQLCRKLFDVLNENKRPEKDQRVAMYNVLRFCPEKEVELNHHVELLRRLLHTMGECTDSKGLTDDATKKLKSKKKVTEKQKREAEKQLFAKLLKEVEMQNRLLVAAIDKHLVERHVEAQVPSTLFGLPLSCYVGDVDKSLLEGLSPEQFPTCYSPDDVKGLSNIYTRCVPEGVLNMFVVDPSEHAEGKMLHGCCLTCDGVKAADADASNEAAGTPEPSESPAEARAARTNTEAGLTASSPPSRDDVMLDETGYTWSCLGSATADGKDVFCENCKREYVCDDARSPYYFDIYWVWSSDLLCSRSSPLIKYEYIGDRVDRNNGNNCRQRRKVCLCTECHNMTVKRIPSKERKQWKNVWPSFYYDVLVGYDATTGKKFSDVYSASDLWKFFPDTLRKYWVRSLAEPYGGVMEENCKSHFVDRTDEVTEFWQNICKRTFKGMLTALDPGRVKKYKEGEREDKNIVVPDVLCPWGCCEFPFRSRELDPAIVMQHHLRRVQLNLPTDHDKLMHEVETSRLDYIRRPKENVDFVLLNPDWPIRPTVRMIPGRGIFVCTCRHHDSRRARMRLYPHPPRKPPAIGNLSSVRPDQLCSVVIQPRIARPVVRKGKNTMPSVSVFHCSYAGADSANVTTERRFENTGLKRVNFEHEVLSFNRSDIDQISRALVAEGKIPEEMYHTWTDEYRKRNMDTVCRDLTRGATYTPTVNAIQLQKASSEDDMVDVWVIEKKKKTKKDKAGKRDILVQLRRSWCPMIYNMQVQDGDCYGWPPKAVPYVDIYRKAGPCLPIMITWSILGIVSASKELYSLIDRKVGGHSHKNFSGYLLTWIHCNMMKHCDRLHVKKTPFSNKTNLTKLATMIMNAFPQHIREDCNRRDPEKFYMFGHSLFEELFSKAEYPKIAIAKKRDQLKLRARIGTEVIILVTKDEPRGPAFFVSNEKKFEARVVMGIAADKDTSHKESNQGRFEACRFVRHGGGFTNWWQQDRNRNSKMVMKQAPSIDDSLVDNFPVITLKDDEGEKEYFRRYLVVYVLVSPDTNVEEYKLDLLTSFGGQRKVTCGCERSETNPVIITGVRKEERRQCMEKNCSKPEKYICPKVGCETRLCTSCFKSWHEWSVEHNKLCVLRPGTDEDASDSEEYDPAQDNSQGVDDYEDEPDVDFFCSGDDEGNSLDNCFETEEYGDDDLEQGLRDEAEEYEAQHPFKNGLVRVHDGFDYDPHQQYEDESVIARFEEEDYDSEDEETTTREQMLATSNLVGGGREDGNHYDPEDRMLMEDNHEVDAFDSTMVDDTPMGDGPDTANIPRVNAAVEEKTFLFSRNDAGSPRVPMHVLFNQAGRLCTRRDRQIEGSMIQKNFVQRLVSTIKGCAIPILWFHAMFFPRHFFAAAPHDKSATFGCAPISCYGRKTNPDGFASTLQMARNLSTHASSSTATDDNFTAYLYDIQANAASAGIDSRLAIRSGFRATTDNKSSGFSLGERDKSSLTESLESSQASMNLAAAAYRINFHAFLTYTCNQSDHPGIHHLHDWVYSENEDGWFSRIDKHEQYCEVEREDIRRSMDMAYSNILTRCWLEVRRLWLQFIVHSTETMLGRVVHSFFRDEYQECAGNLSHIHGLITLCDADLSNKELVQFVCNLQKNCVGDLVRSDEIDDYIEKGLLRDMSDYHYCNETAFSVLSHNCGSRRCLMRVDHTGDPEKDYRCKKINPVEDSKDPTKDEFQPLPHQFSADALQVLLETGHWKLNPDEMDTDAGELHGWQGSFCADGNLSEILEPKRHVGKCHPGATENMSPVMTEHFLFSRSQQNMQVLAGTGGATRYVVKYIVKMDKGNRCIVWADSQSGEVLNVTKDFIHNSKTGRSAVNERKAFEASRAKNHPIGRYIGLPQMLHCLLGESEIYTNIKFEEISTMPFEYRAPTRVKLDRNGNLMRPDLPPNGDALDTASMLTDSVSIRAANVPEREFGYNQLKLLQPQTRTSKKKATGCSYDHITLFGLRPVELLELFPRVRDYYEWFIPTKGVLSREDIVAGLQKDVKKCRWIDALGRGIRIREKALPLVKQWLAELAENRTISDSSAVLRDHLLDIISSGLTDPLFIEPDSGEDLPIAVFSKVSPNRPAQFLLHLMLVLGEFCTELDFKAEPSMKAALAKTKLIPSENLDDEEALRAYSTALMRRVVNEILPYQPLTMKKVDEFIVAAKNLIDSVLLKDAVPITDLPPSILTELLKGKDEELAREWEERTTQQLDVMLDNVRNIPGVPTKEEVLSATKLKPHVWDPLKVITQASAQSNESYAEQQLSLRMGINAITRYSKQFSEPTYAKGVLTNGAPGAGKTFIQEIQGLYAMSQGLRVMSTSLMAIRSNALGGINIHRLFQLPVNKAANLFRLAEIAKDKLYQKRNVVLLHLILTMDVLLIDEVGQLSAQQFALLDIILRHLRKSNLPFGGVLIFGTFDHAQIGAIQGLPFLMSSHLQSDFTLIMLKHSVRAANDKNLQEIQRITRLNPIKLRTDEGAQNRFRTLMRENIKFVKSWDSKEITPQHMRLYHRRLSAQEALDKYIEDTKKTLDATQIKYHLVTSKDMRKASDSLSTFKPSSDKNVEKLLDRSVRETRRVLFFPGAAFEATVNNDQFSQSQLLVMVDLPTEEQIHGERPVAMMAAPPGFARTTSLFDITNPPKRKDLEMDGWTHVTVQYGETRPVIQHHIVVTRRQYTAKHLAASTVNKVMGTTLSVPCAIEITKQFFPWERGQVVVGLSRNHACDDMLIVGEQEHAIERMLKTLTQVNQWTALTEDIVENLSFTGEGVRNEPSHTIDVADKFPYRVCDIQFPNTNSGFVYLLVSTRSPSHTYVGTTANMKVRLDSHNSGRGSFGTNVPHLMPWFVASYMTGMIHMTADQRKHVEWKWQQLNLESQRQGRGNLEQYMENGRYLVTEENIRGYGSARMDERLHYVYCVGRRYKMESDAPAEERQGRDEDLHPLPILDNGEDDDMMGCDDREDELDENTLMSTGEYSCNNSESGSSDSATDSDDDCESTRTGEGGEDETGSSDSATDSDDDCESTRTGEGGEDESSSGTRFYRVRD